MNKIKNKLNYLIENNGFTIVELIISIGIVSTLSGLILPSFLNWMRSEKVNAYTRELREYLRVVRLEARRWGASCTVNLNPIIYSEISNKNLNGYIISCDKNESNIRLLAPEINKSIFQIANKDFLITPNGRVSSDESIIIVIGSKYFMTGVKILNCLVIQSPTGHVLKGRYSDNNWNIKNIKISSLDNEANLKMNKCEV